MITYHRQAFPTWMSRAACARHPHPEWWDDRVAQETDAHRDERHTAAIHICHQCPVIAECQADIQPKQDEGIRAGRRLRPLDAPSGGIPAPREHGTLTGYWQHVSRGRDLPACRDCKDAYNEQRDPQRGKKKAA